MTNSPSREKPTPLSDRVYKKHRKILAAIVHVKGYSQAEALRTAIENEGKAVLSKKVFEKIMK